MTNELPPRDFLTGEVRRVNRQLGEISQEIPATTTFVPQQLTDKEREKIGIVDTETPAGFWNHHIAGPFGALNAVLYLSEQGEPLDRDTLTIVQNRLYVLMGKWQEHPNGRQTEIEQESCTAFSAVAFSADWATTPGILKRLKPKVIELANYYALLEGKRLL